MCSPPGMPSPRGANRFAFPVLRDMGRRCPPCCRLQRARGDDHQSKALLRAHSRLHYAYERETLGAHHLMNKGPSRRVLLPGTWLQLDGRRSGTRPYWASPRHAGRRVQGPGLDVASRATWWGRARRALRPSRGRSRARRRHPPLHTHRRPPALTTDVICSAHFFLASLAVCVLVGYPTGRGGTPMSWEPCAPHDLGASSPMAPGPPTADGNSQ